ncbi:hypothetical protein [Chiayiivirga flava]|uniref:Uncharacterized protein n=1 Tax=Chiayiivirga flava TaxID=659595 RepID=A0A7W8D4W2_9GAMM|nr:hypothetical protein [Chiayiivirga flava]MBB5207986.1 hypothetical protein [Chiayiivirga flava]
MKRRQFLGAGRVALVGAGIAALPLRHAAASEAAPRFRLLRRDGGRLRPLVDCGAQPACDAARLVVHLQPLQPAPGGATLARLRLSAMFDALGAPQSPFHMLHFSAADPAGTTRPYRFMAARESLRALQIEYSLHDDPADTCRSERCSLVAQPFAALEPGDYVLAGPARDRLAANATDGLLDDPARDFDYVAFRIAVAG